MRHKRIRYSRKRIFVGLFLLLCLIGIGIGYAFVTTKLEIDGIVHVKDARWDIHFTNFQLIAGSINSTIEPTISGTNITFAAKVNNPGDFYGFTVDVVNQGTINADISSFALTPDFSNVDYIDATVEYANSDEITNGDILLAGTKKTVKVLLKYKEGLNEEQYPADNQLFNISFTLNYEQNTDYIADFQNDSWTTIKANVQSDKKIYSVGSTKTFEMDLDGNNINETYTLRVVNNTTPSECNTQGFSQSACGFVVEFTDIVDELNHKLNQTDNDGLINGDANKGGWEYSDIRAYLNGGIYLEGLENEINYTSQGVYDKLPTNIKSSIIKTFVVSSYGPNDSANFETEDWLYLLAAHEVWDDVDGDSTVGLDSNDTAYNDTRQLDYYKQMGVTTSSYSAAGKKAGSTPFPWALRSVPSSVGIHAFFMVYPNGSQNYSYPDGKYGSISAFRLAE